MVLKRKKVGIVLVGPIKFEQGGIEVVMPKKKGKGG